MIPYATMGKRTHTRKPRASGDDPGIYKFNVRKGT